MSAPTTDQLEAAAREAREFYGTPAWRAMVNLLAALDGHHMQVLRDVRAPDLERTQGRLEQVAALHKLLTAEKYPGNGAP